MILKDRIKLNKQQIISGIFILFCLFGYMYFPASNFFQYKAVALVFLIILPFLYNKYFLKNNVFFKKNIIGDWKNNLKWLLLGLLGSFFIVFLLFRYTDLLRHYLLSPEVKTNFGKFLWYELTGVAFTVAVYEIFFRGFIQTYFYDNIGKWAILLQFLFFIGMSLVIGLPYWFYVTYLIFTPFAGWITYKSNSFFYSFIGQLFFIIIVDASFIVITTK